MPTAVIHVMTDVHGIYCVAKLTNSVCMYFEIHILKEKNYDRERRGYST